MPPIRPGPAAPQADPAGLAARLAFLRRPEAYPEAPAAVEARETHMSWVFLTDAFAYKLKKPVRYPFLDYRSLERRRHFCAEELRLNRRLAPEVYLDVLPLVQQPDGALRIGGAGEVVDWLVRMRRLPAGRLLDGALAARTATAAEVARAAEPLAAFYVAAMSEPVAEDVYLGRFSRELALNHQVLHDGTCGLPEDAGAAVLGTLDGFLAGPGRAALLERLRAGRIVEGHGDLRPEHVFLGEPPAIIDCLEFDRALRLLDPFEELAFLTLECALLDGAWAGRIILEKCAAALHDRPPASLLAFYTAFRACLRARQSIAHLQEPAPREPAKWLPKTLRYLALAEAACAGLGSSSAAGR